MSIKEHIKKVDAIIPLACLTGAPLCAQDPKGAESIILDAVKMILKLSSKDQMVIYPTTNSGYGVGEKGIHCTEETPLRPVSLYAETKVAIEEEVLRRSGNETCCTALRFATIFGVSPRMRFDLTVNDFTATLLVKNELLVYGEPDLIAEPRDDQQQR